MNTLKWQLLGEHFGYPGCCITSFIKNFGAMNNPKGSEVSNNTGFIPCSECADKILAGEIELKDLITNRKHSKPFPESNMDEMFRSVL